MTDTTAHASGPMLVVTIDTECDKGARWVPEWPLAFRSVTVGVTEKLDPLFVRHGVRPTYFLSPEVIRDKDSRAALLAVRDRVELATHLHGEHMEEQAEPAYAGPGEFQCRYRPEDELARMTTLTRSFEDAFGFHPVSFRAGRFGASANTIRCLEQLGYLNDSSVTPHLRWSDRPDEMNFIAAPEQPYFPSLQDIGRPGHSSILELPVSIAGSVLGDLLREKFALDQARGTLYRIVRRAVRARWLRPTMSTVEQMVSVSKAFMEKHHTPRTPLVLVMLFHAGEVVPGASPYSLEPSGAETVYSRIDGALTALTRLGIRPVTLAEAAERVRASAPPVSAV